MKSPCRPTQQSKGHRLTQSQTANPMATLSDFINLAALQPVGVYTVELIRVYLGEDGKPQNDVSLSLACLNGIDWWYGNFGTKHALARKPEEPQVVDFWRYVPFSKFALKEEYYLAVVESERQIATVTYENTFFGYCEAHADYKPTKYPQKHILCL